MASPLPAGRDSRTCTGRRSGRQVVSRHRSPGGRYAPPRLDAHVVAPGARGTQPAHHRALSESALRNGMSAAAAAGGVLAVVMPAVAVTSPDARPAPADDATVLRLASDEE